MYLIPTLYYFSSLCMYGKSWQVMIPHDVKMFQFQLSKSDLICVLVDQSSSRIRPKRKLESCDLSNPRKPKEPGFGGSEWSEIRNTRKYKIRGNSRNEAMVAAEWNCNPGLWSVGELGMQEEGGKLPVTKWTIGRRNGWWSANGQNHRLSEGESWIEKLHIAGMERWHFFLS